MYQKGSSRVTNGLLTASFPPLVVFRGIIYALIVSAVLLVLFASIFYFSPLSERFVPYFIYGGTLLSILLGSLYVGKRVEKGGWLKGGITGLLYVLVLFILAYLILPDYESGSRILLNAVLGFSFGTLGGILGINS